MRLLHVIPYYRPETAHGGPVEAVHGLCRALAVRGHAVQVLTTADGSGCFELDGVRVEAVRRGGLSRFFYAPDLSKALDSALAQNDLVHVHGLYTWPSWLVSLRVHTTNRPVMLSPHGMLMRAAIHGRSRWLKRLWIATIERNRLRSASAVHFSSAHEWQEYRVLALPERPHLLVPHGVELSAASPPPVGRRTVLFLGRLCWIKGLDRLLRALALLPDVELVLAGPDQEGYAALLKSLSLRLGVSARLRWVGHADQHQKRQLFKEAAVLVLPSYSENFGMVVLEAWAAGRPVVVTPEVGLSDVVRNSGGGLVAEGEPQALADAIRRLLEDQDLNRRAAAAGREIIAREFTWSSIAERMEMHYRQLIETHERAAR